MNVNQYLMIQLEIMKDITINDKVAPQVKFEMNLPHGVPWADAEAICDEFKAALQQMQKNQAETLAKQQAEQSQPEAEIIIEPEIIS